MIAGGFPGGTVARIIRGAGDAEAEWAAGAGPFAFSCPPFGAEVAVDAIRVVRRPMTAPRTKLEGRGLDP
jgi:hypothetical protein